MEQLELLASDLDNAREVLRCVIGRIRSAGGSALWEGRSTKSMYVQPPKTGSLTGISVQPRELGHQAASTHEAL